MYRLGALIGAIAVTAFAGAALAHDESQAKQHGSRVQRISTSEMQTRLNDLGYEVRRIEAEHGKFDARLVERQCGRAVKATFTRARASLFGQSSSREAPPRAGADPQCGGSYCKPIRGPIGKGRVDTLWTEIGFLNRP